MAISPLTLGAAATAAASVAQVIPTPGDFLSALQRATGAGAAPASAAANASATSPTTVTKPTAEARREARDTMHRIERALARFLGRNGIDDAESIELSADETGRIKVGSSRGDAKQIEALLAGDREITGLINEGLKTAGLVPVIGGTNFDDAPANAKPAVKSLRMQSGQLTVAA